MSHPTRVRGLKWIRMFCEHVGHMSHPTRVRGLKCQKYHSRKRRAVVAPYAGAWIEMFTKIILPRRERVAPYAGAWIEICIICPVIYGLGCRTLRGCVD